MAICNSKPATAAEACQVMERTVYKMAHKYARNHRQDFDDLVQRGFVGVMEAYNRYDDSRNMAFSSFAYQWIFPLIKDYAKGNWKVYNATSAVDVETAMGDDVYEMDMESTVDYQHKLESMDDDTRAIVVARHEGYTFREIAEALTKLGQPCTLHQVRNRYMEAMDQ